MTVKAFAEQSCAHLGDPLCRYVQELLSRLGQPEHYVELHIFPTRTATKTALQAELEQLDIPGSLVVPDFATFHEAFAGYPRIWISSEDADLEDFSSRARLQHEVGHAVLHWEISSYLLGLPPSLRALVEAGRLSGGEASAMSYLVSIGVKDFQVSSLLDRFGIREDQEAFYLRELARGEVAEGKIAVLNEMKVIMAAYPFRKNPAVGAAIDEAVSRLGSCTDLARQVLSRVEDAGDLDLGEIIEVASRTMASWMACG